jgi:hypothetical protein
MRNLHRGKKYHKNFALHAFVISQKMAQSKQPPNFRKCAQSGHPAPNKKFKKMEWKQGDQIGRIFAKWAIVNFGQLFRKLQK